MAGPAHVDPHGPALAIGDPELEVHKLNVSDQDNNAYLLTDPATGAQLLVDAADDAEALLALVRAHGDGGLSAVLTTHQHWDHHRALPAVVAATGAQVLAGSEDADALPSPVDRRLVHGDTIALGAHNLDVIALRGHTPGSVALAARTGSGTLLLTGDSLFPGGVGRTGSPGDFTSLLDDVEARLFALYPDETAVHPGHGDSTTLGAERPALEEWRARGW
ncbi:MBL fold metallo-hydrolase [Pseudactinotalea suaedae]|uniref:MBL fold metallo-hydrolase n=1 Tax=Pseudactinotalea suaedae TaxID=1524924 RepID=UPI0012E19CD8|nr:MBL fold metallo-hydrolase [Pseudactinotalea suaedae]